MLTHGTHAPYADRMTNIGAVDGRRAPFGVPELTLGWRLQMALDHGDVSVEDMAVKLGVSRATISRWLHDGWRKRPPRDPDLQVWARVCRVPYGWLIGDAPDSVTGEYEVTVTLPKVSPKIATFNTRPEVSVRKRGHLHSVT